MEFRIVRSFGKELPVARERLIVAESYAYRGMRRAVHPVVRIQREQLLHLLPCPDVLVPLQQHDGVFVARLAMLGRELEHPGEQELGIVRHVEIEADLGEQPHSLHMVAMREQVVAHHAFRIQDIAVGIHAECGDDLVRQRCQIPELRVGLFGVSRASQHAIEGLQRAPAGRQRRTHGHRPFVGLDGRFGGPLGDVAMTALLIETGVSRVRMFQPLERLQRLGDALQIAKAHRDHVQHIAALRRLGGQHLRSRESLRELALLQQCAYPLDFRLEPGRRRGDDRWLHFPARGLGG